MRNSEKKRVHAANCAMIGCFNNRGNSTGIRFFTFPSKRVDPGRREKWIQAVRRVRKDGTRWEPSNYSSICSQHFVSGAPIYHPNNPDYAPSIFPKVYGKTEKSLERHKRLERRNQNKTLNSQPVSQQDLDELGRDVEQGLDEASKLQLDQNVVIKTEIISSEFILPTLFCADSTQTAIPMPQVNVNEPTSTASTITITELDNSNIALNATMEDVDSRSSTIIDIQQTESNTKCENLKSASTSEMSEIKSIKCFICGARLKLENELESHLKEFHPNRKEPRYCHKCHRNFPSLVEFYSHKCIKISAFVCGNCGRSFDLKAELMRHMKTHRKNEPQSENEPSEKEPSKKAPSEKEPTEFLCSKCTYRCKTKTGIICHERIHGKRTRLCRYCCFLYTDKNEFSKHVCNRPPLKKFCCEVCGTTWKNESQLLKHQTVHATERNFECDVCDKKFKSKSYLKAHMDYHSEKRYICDHCSKGFFKLARLKIHLRLHTGETPYKCTICGKEYPWETSFKMHMKRHEVI